ncbi:MAG: DotU family type IV/VI secretion system protein [Deltaproteobacteria bacterium]|jgi:hypothetical protein|nr:DotU family type IV/VI secretion system protein [Deltaproteobacteria bacterium]
MHFFERFYSILKPVLDAVSGQTPTPVWSELSNLIIGRLRQECDRPLPPDFEAGEAELARFPFLAWIDEAILTSGRSKAEDWYRYGLLRSYRGVSEGGDHFFVNLENILRSRARGLVSDTDLANNVRTALIEPESHDLILPGRVRLSGLPGLWLKPGAGPNAVVEEILDCYAICLRMGFRGRLAEPGYAETRRTLLELARLQIETARKLRPIRPVPIKSIPIETGAALQSGKSVLVGQSELIKGPSYSNNIEGSLNNNFEGLSFDAQRAGPSGRDSSPSGQARSVRSAWSAQHGGRGWILLFILGPSLLTAYVFYKSLIIIDSFPF